VWLAVEAIVDPCPGTVRPTAIHARVPRSERRGRADLANGKEQIMPSTRVIAACVAAFYFGCSNGSSQQTMPFSEHRPAEPVGGAARHLGEDCTAAGYQACVSQLCGHFNPAPESGYFCTRRCAALVDCPRHWNCAQVFPGEGGSLCVPPAAWDAGVAVLRDGGIE
jgi:hypothetical protein